MDSSAIILPVLVRILVRLVSVCAVCTRCDFSFKLYMLSVFTVVFNYELQQSKEATVESGTVK